MKFFSKNPDQVEVTVSTQTILRVVGLIFLAIVLFAALARVTHALTLIVIAFFLALALNAPVHWLAHKFPGGVRGNRTLATTISFLIVVVAIGLLLASIVPPLVRQTTSFVESVPGLVDDLHDSSTTLGGIVERYSLEDQVDNLSEQANEWASNLTSGAFTTVSRFGSSVVSVLTVLVLTFMMLIEGPRWLKIAQRLTPDKNEPHVQALSASMYNVVKGYVNGQLVLAAIAAILLLPVLLLMDVSYPFALMVIVFICGLIPMVGHTIGAIIVSLVALFTSPIAALVVFGYYILYQQIENYAVQPRIQASSTDMSPLLVFSAVVIGISFNGIVGGLIAIPVAGCLRILVLDYLVRHELLQPNEVPAGVPIPPEIETKKA